MAAAGVRRGTVVPVDGDGEETGGPGPAARRRWATAASGPTGRAVLGGVLVATAAVGVVAATTGGEAATTPVVVAAVALAPGTPLGPDVLDVVRNAVPDELRDATFTDPTALTGTVSRGALAPGE
ncbi:MAG TPA: SAF domain-containing protein, partial [Acidimicrobiales bacterium]|nr:SAF domain-containing protein [Acidimicrobiales bacterium]